MVELEVSMELADHVCHVLALTIADVNERATPSQQAEVAELRRAFIEVWVAVKVGRLSPEQATPALQVLEAQMLGCRACLAQQCGEPEAAALLTSAAC
jgi:hypothetical protein